MPPITHDTIRNMAADLAGNLFAVLAARADGAPVAATAADLAGPLTPGVAAFIGQLTVMFSDHGDALEDAIGRFLAQPATAEAIGRYQAGDYEAENDLFDGLLSEGVQGGLALRYALSSALGMMLAAVTAFLQRAAEAGGDGAAAAGELLALLARSGPHAIDPYALRDFVDQYVDQGLDRVESGAMFASDGVSILYAWRPPALAGPPDALPELGMDDGPYESVAGDGLEFIDGQEIVDEGGELPAELPAELPETSGSAPPPEPSPSAPEPESPVVDLRLDAALPERVTVGRTFDLAVAIRRPASPVVVPDDLDRSESADFTAVFPPDAPYIQFQLQVSAPDCDIEGGDTRAVRLYAGKDSPLVYFQIAPRAAGPLSVIITVYQAMDWIGSTRLKTQAAMMETRGELNVTVDSRPVGNGEANLITLRTALDDGYNDNELRDLCFELGIDYEDLGGDNQSAKARELVLFAKRRNRTADLVRLIMRDRPHLLVSG